MKLGIESIAVVLVLIVMVFIYFWSQINSLEAGMDELQQQKSTLEERLVDIEMDALCLRLRGTITSTELLGHGANSPLHRMSSLGCDSWHMTQDGWLRSSQGFGYSVGITKAELQTLCKERILSRFEQPDIVTLPGPEPKNSQGYGCN